MSDDQDDISTEELAEQEHQQAAEEDRDKAYDRSDRPYEGKWHGPASHERKDEND